MLKKNFILLTIICLLILSGIVPNIIALRIEKNNINSREKPSNERILSIVFNKTYGGEEYDYGWSVQQTSDNGYIIAGYTQSLISELSILRLIKTDSSGNILWDKMFGGTGWNAGFSVQQTNDDGYIITGVTESFNYGSPDVWLLKIDKDGSVLWNRIFDASGWDAGFSVQQTSDDGYIILGGTLFETIGNYDVLLIKTDIHGNILWNKTLGGSESENGWSVDQTSDGGFIIVGDTGSFGAGNQDVWLIKTDSNGNEQWNITYGGAEFDYGYSVQLTRDGGYIIAGYTNSFGVGDYNVWLIKTDSSGNILWDKMFGGSGWDAGFSVQQTSDEGYIITGYTYSFGAGSSDVWLIKTDNYGNELWNYTFGGINLDKGRSVLQTSDDGYIITGETGSFGVGRYDVWLIKTDANGKVKNKPLNGLTFQFIEKHPLLYRILQRLFQI